MAIGRKTPKVSLTSSKLPNTYFTLHRLYEPREDYDQLLHPNVTFKPRDIMAEMQVMYEFLTRGIDREDVEYLRRAYESLLAEDAQGYWLNDTHWVDHTPTDVCYSPPKKKSKRHNNIYEDLQVIFMFISTATQNS